MNTLSRSEAQALIENQDVVRAWADGKEIQYKKDGTGAWQTANPHMSLGFVFSQSAYRVKPREIWAIYRHGQFDTTRMSKADAEAYVSGYNYRMTVPAKFEIVKMVESA